MLIDFCQSFMKPKIKSDNVSFDGYEPTNLVSENALLKRKGFMSDHFVKPPVHVTVQFPCNVSIYRIVIDPVIGQQQSCDIRIFAATEKVTKSWLYMNDSSDREAVETNGTMFNVIGNNCNNANSVGAICFQNSYFKESSMWRIHDLPALSEYPVTTQFRSRKPGCLCNASHVTISVLRTRSSGSAAIKRLEIWGKPSATVTAKYQHNLLQIYQYFIQPPPVSKVIPEQDLVSTSKTDLLETDNTGTSELKEEGIHIPDDFIDVITQDVMAVPMLLPSGKIIDQSTIERYINTEAVWGRAPNDPFTGISFGPGRQPEINAPLKSRLDKFLLMNSDKLKHVARTLGRAANISGKKSTLKSSRLIPTSVLSTQGIHNHFLTPDTAKTTSVSSTNSNSCHSPLEPIYTSSEIQPSQPMEKASVGEKRKLCDKETSKHSLNCVNKRPRKRSWTQTCVTTCTKPAAMHNICGDQTIDLTGPDDSDAPLLSNNVSMTTPKMFAHSANLTSSLDAALSATLGGLPSFTSFTKPTTKADTIPSHTATRSQSPPHICCYCDCDLRQGDVAKYLLPCQHLVCRKCLNSGQKFSDGMNNCGQCCFEFTSDKLIRVFDY